MKTPAPQPTRFGSLSNHQRLSQPPPFLASRPRYVPRLGTCRLWPSIFPTIQRPFMSPSIERFGGKTRFITVAFLVHLLHQTTVPTIDQHNFRAVNDLMTSVRPTWKARQRPSKYADILLVSSFMRGLAPSSDRVDAKRSRARQVPNDVWQSNQTSGLKAVALVGGAVPFGAIAGSHPRPPQ